MDTPDPPPRGLRILLAEDQVLVREALRSLLELEPDLRVVAEVGRGDEVVAEAVRTRPDVALLDIEMPGGSGLDVTAALLGRLPTCRVVILTTFARPGYLHRALDLGAVAFLAKDVPARDLAAAVRRAARGERVIDPALAVAALAEGESPLTEREREVLAAARSGATVPELAGRLFLSPGTVRNHLSAAIQKLGVRTRAEAARLAEDKGWL